MKKSSLHFLVEEVKENKRRNKSNVGFCLISSAIIFLFIVYGSITFHILSHGISLNDSKKFSHSSLATHPQLQHHDLGSIFLEGLPPLRPKKSETSNEGNDMNTFDVDDRSNRRRNAKNKNGKDSSFKYLRRMMPVD